MSGNRSGLPLPRNTTGLDGPNCSQFSSEAARTAGVAAFNTSVTYILPTVVFVGLYMVMMLFCLESVVKKCIQSRGSLKRWSARQMVIAFICLGALARALTFVTKELDRHHASGVEIAANAVKDVAWFSAFSLIVLYWIQLQKYV